MTESRPVHTTSTPRKPEDEDLYQGPRVSSDGRPIIEVQRGQAPAPNPHSRHKLVDFRYLQMILLDNGDTRYRCSRFINGVNGERCWRDDFDNPRSAVAHINNHGQVRTPDYSEDVLRLLIRLVKTYETAGYDNYAILTADHLNKEGIPTVGGQPWNSRQVSNLYLTHKDKFRVHVSQEAVRRLVEAANSTDTKSKTVTVTDVRQERPVSEPTSVSRPVSPAAPKTTTQLTLAQLNELSGKLVKDTDKLYDDIKEHATRVVEFVEQAGNVITQLSQVEAVDPQVIEDAKKWQKYLEFQKLVQGS